MVHDESQNARDEVAFVDILDAILNTDVNRYPQKMWTMEEEFLLQIIQLSLSYLILEPGFSAKLHHFDLSQELAYTSPYRVPLFQRLWGCQVDVKMALSIVNFFRFHLKHSGGEGLLAEDFLDLDAQQQPKPWLGRLKEGTQPLGLHWKGAYSGLPDQTQQLYIC